MASRFYTISLRHRRPLQRLVRQRLQHMPRTNLVVTNRDVRCSVESCRHVGGRQQRSRLVDDRLGGSRALHTAPPCTLTGRPIPFCWPLHETRRRDAGRRGRSIADRVAAPVARLATGWGGYPFAGRDSHPLDDIPNFMNSSHDSLLSDQPFLVALKQLGSNNLSTKSDHAQVAARKLNRKKSGVTDNYDWT
jgi:hypothetical protein